MEVASGRRGEPAAMNGAGGVVVGVGQGHVGGVAVATRVRFADSGSRRSS